MTRLTPRLCGVLPPILLSLLLGDGLILAQTDGALRWPRPFDTLSTATAGSIVSSPAVGPDGTVYIGVQVGAATSPSQSGRLFAITPSGAQKWPAFVAPDWIDSTPAIASDGTVYFGCWDGNLYALRPDGTRKWAVGAGVFITSSPALGSDGTIYVGADSSVVAVNPDGTLRWAYPVADWVDSSPALGPDGTIYFGCWDGRVYALRPDGTEKWRFLTGAEVLGSPAVAADGTVYIGSRDLRLYALTPEGTEKWSMLVNDMIESSPVLGVDGTVYFATAEGRLHAVGADGQERWRYPRASQPALGPITSTPAVRADGSIVFGSSNNAVYALRGDGTLLWRTALGDATDSSPVVTIDGSIYIGCSDKRVYALTSTVPAATTDWPQFRRDGQRSGWQPMGAVKGTAGRLVNVSVRTYAGLDADTLIVGFAVAGAGSRSLLVRGVGPTLSNFNVTGPLANPSITLHDGVTILAENDDWGQAPNASDIAATASQVGAFPLPAGSADAALLRGFAPGSFTVPVQGAGGGTGIALLEVYDADGGAEARLTNVSARSAVSSGSGTLIAGFVIRGGQRAVLVRGIGPALAGFGVAGALENPHLRIYLGERLIAENNDWSVSANALQTARTAQAVGGFALAEGTRDAALLLTLPPGAYTAQISGATGSPAHGVALVEVYEVP